MHISPYKAYIIIEVIYMKEKEKKSAENDGYLFPAASWGDMTGLIPSGLNDGEEINSYENIYPYLPEEKS